MISLRQYLRASKDVLSKCVNADRTIHVVFGNQAGDCDSIVCSLLQGYYLFTTTSPPAQKDLIFPVLPIPESDFKLRGETAALLDKCGIPTSELIFMDQVKWGEVSVGKVTLVDHNVLSERMSFLEPSPQGTALRPRCTWPHQAVALCLRARDGGPMNGI